MPNMNAHRLYIRYAGLLACTLVTGALQAGILVSHSAKGFQFTDAFSVALNGKDKALSLGASPKIAGPVNKLPNTKLGGTLLKDASSNVIALYDQGNVEYLLPQGLPKTAAGDAAALWRSAEISYRKSSSDKTPNRVAISDFVAFLPAGSEELVRLTMDGRALQLIAGAGKAFPVQLELLAAVVKSYPADPAMTPLAKFVEQSMRRRYDQFETGVAGVEALDEALQFAALSQAVYPNQPEQQRLRTALAERKAWLDRKIAILRAFAAAGEWDAFLLANRDFEVYEHAFPDMLNKHKEALKSSLELHRATGNERLKEGEYRAAVREFRVASFRQPSDSVLQEERREAWTEYSRRYAIDHQRQRQSLTAGQHDAVERALYFADQNRQASKLDEALKNVLDAESVLTKSLPADTIAPESLKVFYKKAEILGAQGSISEALAALDQYDLHAVDTEREQASQLRNQLLFQLQKTVNDVKAQLKQAWTEQRYNRVRQLSLAGLHIKGDDPVLLYNAGVSSLITRNRKDAASYLTRYMDVSNTLEANADERALVRRLLPTAVDKDTSSEGVANWLSGKKLPKGVYYCPISLAFQPKIERIDASNKLKVAYEWEGERLKTITPLLEKTDHPTGERKIVFAYNDRVPQVSWVGYAEEPRPGAPSTPDDALRNSSVVLLNNPYIDPVAAQKLTGNNMSTIVSGNRFFNPFVWEKLYFFRVTYDDQGRVSQARELSGRNGAPGALVLEFEWNGMQLAAIRGYEGPDDQHRSKVYERTLEYEGTHLAAETIDGQGKASHIKYLYKANRIVSANCEKDATVDGRSRQVTFAGNSPTTQVD